MNHTVLEFPRGFRTMGIPAYYAELIDSKFCIPNNACDKQRDCHGLGTYYILRRGSPSEFFEFFPIPGVKAILDKIC